MEYIFFHFISPSPLIFPQIDIGTGEHSVGLGKKKYLVDELGEGTVLLMKTLKSALDPLNLFNPGKVGRIEPLPCTCLALLTYSTTISCIPTNQNRNSLRGELGYRSLTMRCGEREVIIPARVGELLV